MELATRYLVSHYRASGTYTWAGTATVLLASVTSGALIGLTGGLVSVFFYLVVLYPLLCGAGTGAVAAALVRRARLRHPIIAGLCALCGAAVTMPIVHSYGYPSFQRQRDQLSEATRAEAMTISSPDALPEDLRAAGVDPQVIRAARVTNVARYIDLQAHEGVRFSRGGWKGIRLGYRASYVYWGAEVLLAMAVAFVLAYRAAAAPFCKNCGNWMRERRLGSLWQPAGEAATAIESGDLGQLRPLQPGKEAGELTLTLFSCPRCGSASEATLRLDRVRGGRRNKGTASPRTLAHTVYPGHAIPGVEGLFTQAPLTTPPSPPPASVGP